MLESCSQRPKGFLATDPKGFGNPLGLSGNPKGLGRPKGFLETLWVFGGTMAKQIPLVYGGYYHIYNRGNNRENIFIEERNYAYFLNLYAKYIEPVAETYAYCLLRNHFHLLVRIRTEDELVARSDPKGSGNKNPKGLGDPSGLKLPIPSQQFGKLFDAYAKAINKAYNRTGSLFQHPFGRIRVTSDEYFVQLVQYIHFNPQKHGFVTDFREYPYSSYHALLSHKPTKLARAQVIEWFNSQAAFVQAHQTPMDEKRIAHWIAEDAD